jgi:hypothetical protein
MGTNGATGPTGQKGEEGPPGPSVLFAEGSGTHRFISEAEEVAVVTIPIHPPVASRLVVMTEGMAEHVDGAASIERAKVQCQAALSETPFGPLAAAEMPEFADETQIGIDAGRQVEVGAHDVEIRCRLAFGFPRFVTVRFEQVQVQIFLKA